MKTLAILTQASPLDWLKRSSATIRWLKRSPAFIQPSPGRRAAPLTRGRPFRGEMMKIG